MSNKVVIVWRGDPTARAQATPENNRFHRIFSALLARGVEAEPAVYCEELHDEVRAQLLKSRRRPRLGQPVAGRPHPREARRPAA